MIFKYDERAEKPRPASVLTATMQEVALALGEGQTGSVELVKEYLSACALGDVDA